MLASGRLLLIALLLTCIAAANQAQSRERAQWIWTPAETGDATNRFTYFRKRFHLARVDERAAVLFAADSQARLIVNGHVVARKVTRFTTRHIRPDRLLIGPWLQVGANELIVLHHNWGPIKNFQREVRRDPGLWLEPVPNAALPEIGSGEDWETVAAPEFLRHTQQIVGLTGDLRVRFPVIADGALVASDDTARNKLQWTRATIVKSPIWTILSAETTPPQREYFVPAQRIIAAGHSSLSWPGAIEARSDLRAAHQLAEARYEPEASLLQAASRLPLGDFAKLRGEAGRTLYLTLDMHQPIHGYPSLTIETNVRGAMLTFAYGELAASPIDGRSLLNVNTGWLDPAAIVGTDYFDRYFTAGHNIEAFEFPDERTARYLLVCVTFPSDAPPNPTITFRRLGFVKSQYPVSWAGSFEAGVAWLNQVISLSKIHAEITMTDAYVDTPGREDGVWLEDIQPRARISDTWLDDASEARRRVLLLAEESRLPDGRFLSFGPQSFVEVANWDWGIRWISMLGDEWHWSGDRRFLEARMSALTTYLERLLERVDDRGLFRSNALFADIRVGVHPESDRDVSSIMQANLIEALGQAAELANAVGKQRLGRRWSNAQKRCIAAFRRELLVASENGTRFAADVMLMPAGTLRGRSQAAQLAALKAGIYTDDEAREVIEAFFPAPDGIAPPELDAWNNPTYAERALTQLTRYGFGQRALAHLERRYSYYLPFSPANPVAIAAQGPLGGPLPEYAITAQETGAAVTTQPVDPTGSHGWAAVPLVWLHESVLGITWSFDKKGKAGGIIQIAPNDCGLPYLSGTVRTPAGPVYEHWEAQSHQLTVDIPSHVIAEITLPVSAGWSARAPEGGSARHTGPRSFRVVGAGRYVFTL